MSTDPFSDLLDPVAYWDISLTYTRYSGLFDLVIYSTIFIALAHAVFTNRFSGRPGKMMSTAIGIALGISLVLLEDQYGWNLRQAGPIAVLIALLLVGLLLLHTMLRVHIAWSLAVPLTYVLIYLFVRATSPALFERLADHVPFIHVLSAIIFLICVWKIGIALWPGAHPTKSEITDVGFIAALNRPQEKSELKLEKKIKGNLTSKATKGTKKLEHRIGSILTELKRPHPDAKAINQALSGLAHQSDDIVRIIDQIHTLDRRLRNFDWHELQHLNSYYRELDDNDKAKLKEHILLERNKIIQEHAIEELTDRCERRHQTFRQKLDAASKAILIQDWQSATNLLIQARLIEEDQRKDLYQLKQSEKRLINLTKTKLKKSK